jgi:hypothetical protein
MTFGNSLFQFPHHQLTPKSTRFLAGLFDRESQEVREQDSF